MINLVRRLNCLFNKHILKTTKVEPLNRCKKLTCQHCQKSYLVTKENKFDWHPNFDRAIKW